jgi:hypothetical protein
MKSRLLLLALLSASLDTMVAYMSAPRTIHSLKVCNVHRRIMASSKPTNTVLSLAVDDGYPVFPKELGFMNTDTSKRLLPWAGFASICWMFRSFYPIIVGTFFLSVMGNSIVSFIGSTFENVADSLKVPRFNKIPRKLLAATYFILLGLGLARFMLIVSPRIVKESTYVVQLLQSEDPYALTANLFLSTFGVEMTSKLEKLMLAGMGSVTLDLAGLTPTRRLGKLIQTSVKGYLQNLLVFSSKIISNSTTAAYKGVLSLIFSFMVRQSC